MSFSIYLSSHMQKRWIKKKHLIEKEKKVFTYLAGGVYFKWEEKKISFSNRQMKE